MGKEKGNLPHPDAPINGPSKEPKEEKKEKKGKIPITYVPENGPKEEKKEKKDPKSFFRPILPFKFNYDYKRPKQEKKEDSKKPGTLPEKNGEYLQEIVSDDEIDNSSPLTRL